MYRFVGFAAFEAIDEVSVTFFSPSRHEISVRDDADTAQFTPSMDTWIFVLSFENPVPVSTMSCPFGDPEFVLIDVIAGKTVNSWN